MLLKLNCHLLMHNYALNKLGIFSILAFSKRTAFPKCRKHFGKISGTFQSVGKFQHFPNFLAFGNFAAFSKCNFLRHNRKCGWDTFHHSHTLYYATSSYTFTSVDYSHHFCQTHIPTLYSFLSFSFIFVGH